MATMAKVTEITTTLNVALKEQRCLHALTGGAPEHKMCSHAYDCGSCPFDQMLDDMAQIPVHAPEIPEKAVRVA